MTKYWLASLLSVTTLSLLMLVPNARAEDAKVLAARLEAAAAQNVLDVPDIKPWHLKLTVQLFNEKGKATDQGTIEEWWSSPETERREYKTDAYSATEVRVSGKLYRTKGAGSPPYYLELLREQAVHPMPKESEIAESTPDLRKLPFGKVVLDCIMLSQPIKQVPVLPMGLFPTYCFDPGKDLLRASFEFGEQTILRNGLGRFQGKDVATKVSVSSGKTEAANSQIVTLEAASVPASEIELSDNEVEQNLSAVKVSQGVMAGNILTRPDPIYPDSAKHAHVSGVVTLRAIIGTDGHIHSLKLVSAPSPELAISAIVAVRKWTYKPYTLLGVPVDVETTINVNYTFS